MDIVGVVLFVSGGTGRFTGGGIITIAGCTLAQKGTFSTGVLVDEVFRLTWPWTVPVFIGRAAEIVSSNDFPGSLVLSSVLKVALLTSGAKTETSSSRL